jgi:hypothetical protein
MTVIHAVRTPDAEPTLADFEHALAYALRGAIVSDTGMGREVQDALLRVVLAAPNPPKQLLDVAMDAFLRQVSSRSPELWWDQF